MERYSYVGTISSGAYGVVYKCMDAVSGSLVAAKGIRSAHTDAEVMRLTLREVKVLKLLPPHPNIVRLLEAFRSKSGRVYLVFEYIERSLYQELDRHPNGALPPPMVKSVAWQLLHALAHCHDHKVVHRDIKPANVLLTGYTAGRGTGGVAKLCDFGFSRLVRNAPPVLRGAAGGPGAHAKLLQASPATAAAEASSAADSVLDENSRLSSYVMTRWYRPPEVLVGDPTYGTAIDIWSLGCTLAELATGRPLFPGANTVDQLWRIMRCCGPLPPQHMARVLLDRRLTPITTPPPRSRTLQQRLPEVSADLLQLLAACLVLDPRCRPTARELLQMPYFLDVPRLLAGTDLARQLAYAPAPPAVAPPTAVAELTCTINGHTTAHMATAGEAAATATVTKASSHGAAPAHVEASAGQPLPVSSQGTSPAHAPHTPPTITPKLIEAVHGRVSEAASELVTSSAAMAPSVPEGAITSGTGPEGHSDEACPPSQQAGEAPPAANAPPTERLQARPLSDSLQQRQQQQQQQQQPLLVVVETSSTPSIAGAEAVRAERRWGTEAHGDAVVPLMPPPPSPPANGEQMTQSTAGDRPLGAARTSRPACLGGPDVYAGQHQPPQQAALDEPPTRAALAPAAACSPDMQEQQQHEQQPAASSSSTSLVCASNAREPTVRTLVGLVVARPDAAAAPHSATIDSATPRSCEVQCVPMLSSFRPPAACGDAVAGPELAHNISLASHTSVEGAAACRPPADAPRAAAASRPGLEVLRAPRVGAALSEGGAGTRGLAGGLQSSPAAGVAAAFWGAQSHGGGGGGPYLSTGSNATDVVAAATGAVQSSECNHAGQEEEYEEEVSLQPGGLRRLHALVGSLDAPHAPVFAPSAPTAVSPTAGPTFGFNPRGGRAIGAAQAMASASVDALGLCRTSPLGPAQHSGGGAAIPNLAIAGRSSVGGSGGGRVATAAMKPLRAIAQRVRCYLRSGAGSINGADEPHRHVSSTAAAAPPLRSPHAMRRHSAAGAPAVSHIHAGHKLQTHAGGEGLPHPVDATRDCLLGSPTLSECGGGCRRELRHLPCALSPTGAPAMSPIDLSRAPHCRRPETDVAMTQGLLTSLSSGDAGFLSAGGSPMAAPHRAAAEGTAALAGPASVAVLASGQPSGGAPMACPGHAHSGAAVEAVIRERVQAGVQIQYGASSNGGGDVYAHTARWFSRHGSATSLSNISGVAAAARAPGSPAGAAAAGAVASPQQRAGAVDSTAAAASTCSGGSPVLRASTSKLGRLTQALAAMQHSQARHHTEGSNATTQCASSLAGGGGGGKAPARPPPGRSRTFAGPVPQQPLASLVAAALVVRPSSSSISPDVEVSRAPNSTAALTTACTETPQHQPAPCCQLSERAWAAGAAGTAAAGVAVGLTSGVLDGLSPGHSAPLSGCFHTSDEGATMLFGTSHQEARIGPNVTGTLSSPHGTAAQEGFGGQIQVSPDGMGIIRGGVEADHSATAISRPSALAPRCHRSSGGGAGLTVLGGAVHAISGGPQPAHPVPPVGRSRSRLSHVNGPQGQSLGQSPHRPQSRSTSQVMGSLGGAVASPTASASINAAGDQGPALFKDAHHTRAAQRSPCPPPTNTALIHTVSKSGSGDMTPAASAGGLLGSVRPIGDDALVRHMSSFGMNTLQASGVASSGAVCGFGGGALSQTQEDSLLFNLTTGAIPSVTPSLDAIQLAAALEPSGLTGGMGLASSFSSPPPAPPIATETTTTTRQSYTNGHMLTAANATVQLVAAETAGRAPGQASGSIVAVAGRPSASATGHGHGSAAGCGSAGGFRTLAAAAVAAASGCQGPGQSCAVRSQAPSGTAAAVRPDGIGLGTRACGSAAGDQLFTGTYDAPGASGYAAPGAQAYAQPPILEAVEVDTETDSAPPTNQRCLLAGAASTASARGGGAGPVENGMLVSAQVKAAARDDAPRGPQARQCSHEVGAADAGCTAGIKATGTVHKESAGETVKARRHSWKKFKQQMGAVRQRLRKLLLMT